MKKDDKLDFGDDMRPGYDFSRMKDGIQGKYAKAFNEGSNIVRLDPDVAEVFVNDDSVNEALRYLIKIAKDQVNPSPH